MDHQQCKRLVLTMVVLTAGAIGDKSSVFAQESPPPAAYDQPDSPAEPGVATTDTVAAQDGPVAQRPEPARRVVVPYDAGMAIPEGAHVRSRSRLYLWIPGLAVFAASYFITARLNSVAMSMRTNASEGRAWIPFVGGIVVADTSMGRRLAALSTLSQSIGLAMFITGLTLRQRELVYYTDSGRGLVFGAVPLRGGAMVAVSVF